MGWHDVHMSLTGPVVLDIVQHFVERWNELKKRKYHNDPRYDWLALPHDIEAAPNEPVARTSPIHIYLSAIIHARLGHPHLAEWQAKGRRFHQRFHRGYNWRPQPNDHPVVQNSLLTCKVQVCRSSSDWSHGILKEDSIQSACEYFYLLQIIELTIGRSETHRGGRALHLYRYVGFLTLRSRFDAYFM
jgi:phospholipase D1/2